MRCLAAFALLAGAGAFTAPSAGTLFTLPSLETSPRSTAPSHGTGALPPTAAGASVGPRASPEGGVSLGFTLAAAAALAAVLRSASRRRSQGRARNSAATRRAEADIEWGYEDAQTGEKNYVNPWEERIQEELDEGIKPVPSGWKFHPYGGPVYKQVPVAEGLTFPLDPKMYKPPLEPPAPGVKWGDGRDEDGNWYMDIPGEEKRVQYWQGWGRRKTACAIVKIVKGTGQFKINGRDAIEYFQYFPIWWLKAAEPMAALSIKNDYDCICKTFGGGLSGQAGAIRLGLARAMQELNFEWRPLLKKAKYLTRDFRMVEPKKTGRHKARKKKPYHKR